MKIIDVITSRLLLIFPDFSISGKFTTLVVAILLLSLFADDWLLCKSERYLYDGPTVH